MSSSNNKRGLVINDYKAGDSDELSIYKGQIVIIHKIKHELENWLYGELNGKYGFFPKDYVQILMEQCKAIYEYTGEENGKLKFHVGDIIDIIKKEQYRLYGRLNNEEGWVASSFVQEFQSTPLSVVNSNNVENKTKLNNAAALDTVKSFGLLQDFRKDRPKRTKNFRSSKGVKTDSWYSCDEDYESENEEFINNIVDNNQQPVIKVNTTQSIISTSKNSSTNENDKYILPIPNIIPTWLERLKEKKRQKFEEDAKSSDEKNVAVENISKEVSLNVESKANNPIITDSGKYKFNVLLKPISSNFEKPEKSINNNLKIDIQDDCKTSVEQMPNLIAENDILEENVKIVSQTNHLTNTSLNVKLDNSQILETDSNTSSLIKTQANYVKVEKLPNLIQAVPDNAKTLEPELNTTPIKKREVIYNTVEKSSMFRRKSVNNITDFKLSIPIKHNSVHAPNIKNIEKETQKETQNSTSLNDKSDDDKFIKLFTKMAQMEKTIKSHEEKLKLLSLEIEIIKNK